MMEIKDLVRLGGYLQENGLLNADSEIMITVVPRNMSRRIRLRVKQPVFSQMVEESLPYFPEEYEDVELSWVHPGKESLSAPLLVGVGRKSNTVVIAVIGEKGG